MTTDELSDLLTVLKEHGVLSFSGLGIKVELERQAPSFEDIPRTKREELEAKEEEEIAFAHVGRN